MHEDLPLNLKRQYVTSQDKSGTWIFIPVDSLDMKVQKEVQQDLRDFLQKQPNPDQRFMKFPKKKKSKKVDWNRGYSPFPEDPTPPRTA